MQCGRDVAWSNARTAMPKNRSLDLTPRRGVGRESEAPWTYASSPYREVRLPEVPLASRHARNTSAWNARVKRITSRPPKQTDLPGEARGNRARRRRRAKAHSFVGERDAYRFLTRSEDNWMWNPPRLQSRPADPRMTKNSPWGRDGKTLPRAQL